MNGNEAFKGRIFPSSSSSNLAVFYVNAAFTTTNLKLSVCATRADQIGKTMELQKCSFQSLGIIYNSFNCDEETQFSDDALLISPSRCDAASEIMKSKKKLDFSSAKSPCVTVITTFYN